MAGIGFQLKNISKDKTVFGGVKAFAFSTLVIAGPMLMCILLITVAREFMNSAGAASMERELFVAGTLYSFVFSQLITGGFIMVATRYLSDLLYHEREEDILPSLYGTVTIAILIGGILGLIFYSFSPLGLLFKLSSYIFFIELIIIWILSMYISALKEYMQIVKGFTAGVGISALAIWVCYSFFETLTAVQMFLCMDIGFFFIVILFFRSVKIRFPVDNHSYFEFLPYLEKYPALFLTGFFYTLGLYGHILIVWGSELQVIVSSTFIMAPVYDVPVFYAYLTILPAMIGFVVSMETSFYEKYKQVFSKILGSHSFLEIKAAQSKMFQVLSRELIFIMEIQLFFTVCAIAVGTSILPFTAEQIDIFNIIVIGNYFFIVMFIIMQILLYFDDRKGALFTIFSYVLASLTFTVITVMNGSYGLSCFIAGLVGLVIAVLRLYHVSKNFSYYTYCSQPLFAKKEEFFLEKIAGKLHSMNGVEKKY